MTGEVVQSESDDDKLLDPHYNEVPIEDRV